MSRVVLVGRADHDNFGDSLIFAFYVNSLNSTSRKAYILGASSIFIDRLHECNMECDSIELEDVSTDDLVFFVGGGYFGEPDVGRRGWNERFISDGFFGSVRSWLISKNIQYYVHGVEVGPLSSPEVKRIVSDLLGNAKSVVVRNEASQLYCEDELGLHSVSMYRDVVYEETKQFACLIGVCRDSEPEGVIIHATGKVLKANPLSCLARVKLRKMIRNLGVSKVTILFDQTSFPELVPRAQKYAKALCEDGLKAEVKEYCGLESVLSAISSAEYVITTKLHVGVTALALGGRVLCYSSMPKNIRFYDEVFQGNGRKSLLSLFNYFEDLSVSDFVEHESSSVGKYIKEFHRILDDA